VPHAEWALPLIEYGLRTISRIRWEVFNASMKRVFPNRPIVDIDNADPIFHTLYDLDERYQVPGDQFVRTGRLYRIPPESGPRKGG
jgi:hypothetical protein